MKLVIKIWKSLCCQSVIQCHMCSLTIHTVSEKQLLQITLHWLGTGGQYQSVGKMRGVSKAIVCIPLFISDRRW